MTSVAKILSVALLTSSTQAWMPTWDHCDAGKACEYSKDGGCCAKNTSYGKGTDPSTG